MTHRFLPADAADRVGLLAGLTGEELSQVLDAMVLRSFGPGEVILRQGIHTQNVWLLVEGRCEVVKEPPLGTLGQAVKLAEIEPYETFGEMSMFADMPHCTSVWTQTDVKTLKLRRGDFDVLGQLHPSAACRLACNLVNILSGRLRRMDDWISELLDGREDAAIDARWAQVRSRLQRKFGGYMV